MLRLKVGKKPMAGPVRRRVLSPAGAGSIFTTSAPRSARIMPQLGPMTMWLNSRTRMPARGAGAWRGMWGQWCGQLVNILKLSRVASMTPNPARRRLPTTTVGAGNPGRRDPALQRFARQSGLSDLARGKQCLKVDPGLEAFRFQQVDESSVDALPTEPGANGQPPRPPSAASKPRTPSSRAARTLASAMPRVSCRCRLPNVERRSLPSPPVRGGGCEMGLRTPGYRPGRPRPRPFRPGLPPVR